MIVRILGEGQYASPTPTRAAWTSSTTTLVAAVDGGDEAAFTPALPR